MVLVNGSNLFTLPQLGTYRILCNSGRRPYSEYDFDMFYNHETVPVPHQNSLTIDVYVYEMIATNPSKLYYPAAAAFFQSLIGFVLVLTTNAIVRKVEPEMAMF